MEKNNVCGVILASGLSKRMGQNKLLLQLNGTTIFEHVLSACKKSNLAKILVVTSYEEIRNICNKYAVNSIKNEYAHLGQSESIKLGTSYFYDRESIMFISGDTPFLSENLINLLISNFNNQILVPYNGDTPQNPVIFPKKTFDELLALSGDTGGKKVIRSNSFQKIQINCENTDIDTLDDYESAKKRF